MKQEKTFISQAQNYAGNFGEVIRSSAIFWVKNSEYLRTTISFSNYWKFKNFTDVRVFVNLRNLLGELLNRQVIEFEESDVCNYSPPLNFEGSVEVEAFSIKNMRIPYAAIMAVYESQKSISMVHSYARAYSQHEIEEKRTITNGEESCWTLRDDVINSSFSMVHNGPNKQEGQRVMLSVQNWRGNKISVEIQLPELLPFQTVSFEPKNYIDNLIEFLEGQPGNARISFRLNGGFSRMLCGVKTVDNSQLQVTHSNFDYSTHETDAISDGNLLAYMRTPNVLGSYNQEIVVYPDTSKGVYVSEYDGNTKKFKTGEINRIKFYSGEGRLIQFSRTDDILPTRIVTALRLNSEKTNIPAECSLGIVHHKRPKKNFHWMLVSRKFNSQICWVDYKEVYGGCPKNAEFIFKLYSAKEKKEYVKSLVASELPSNRVIRLSSIFDCPDLAEDYCYLSIWCSYGGLMIFSTLEKADSITIEHSF
ncbi:MAG: hypothetical protein RLZZ546_561 [Bacteroidota bacterium]